MRRYLKKSIYYRQTVERLNPPKSKRPYRYLVEEAKKLRKRVLFVSLAILLIFLIYLFFYSDLFKFENIQLEIPADLDQQEVTEKIHNILDENLVLILPQDNFFLFRKDFLKKRFQKDYSLSDLEIVKEFPQTVKIKVVERVGQSLLISHEKAYLVNVEGRLVREIPIAGLVNTKMPVIYDLSNTKVENKEKILDLRLLNLISELFTNFANYNLPSLTLDYFKIDSPEANYVKVVTSQGFEIHLNTILSLEEQIAKLEKSLAAGKIDLTKIIYINLRIPNQVIYK